MSDAAQRCIWQLLHLLVVRRKQHRRGTSKTTLRIATVAASGTAGAINRDMRATTHGHAWHEHSKYISIRRCGARARQAAPPSTPVAYGPYNQHPSTRRCSARGPAPDPNTYIRPRNAVSRVERGDGEAASRVELTSAPSPRVVARRARGRHRATVAARRESVAKRRPPPSAASVSTRDIHPRDFCTLVPSSG